MEKEPQKATVQMPQTTDVEHGMTEELTRETEAAVNNQETSNSEVAFIVGKSKTELLAQMRELAERPIEEVREAVMAVKSAFYALRHEELLQAKADFIARGNEESAFAAPEDEEEKQMKALLSVLKEKRVEWNAAKEAERAENLERKRQIVALIEAAAADPDNINRQYGRIKQLQQDFKDGGEVPASAETEIWKDFQRATEHFYDVLKMNKELRDYDFKKNLEAKQELCTEAEALDEQGDVVAAFKKLQELHAKWREIGPVARELREELWARFKAASAVINKKYQAHFEARKEEERQNAEAKTALCEKVEQLTAAEPKTYAQWEAITQQIVAVQAEWKKLGYASRKANAALWTRLRKACDEFFGRKSEFFKQMKEDLSANLARKTELCERAEGLMNSTDWKDATDQFVAMQKEWKTIGPVAKKHSDAIWKRFISACDHFFEEKKRQNTNAHAVEHENLNAKRELLSQLKAIVESEEPESDTAAQIRGLMDQWQSIGHVPFKEKDNIYAEYRALLDKAYVRFDIKVGRPSTGGKSAGRSTYTEHSGNSERDRLVRLYDQRQNELKTFENNMGFFNAQSKSGNSLVAEMERRIESLKKEISDLEAKIKALDN